MSNAFNNQCTTSGDFTPSDPKMLGSKYEMAHAFLAALYPKLDGNLIAISTLPQNGGGLKTYTFKNAEDAAHFVVADEQRFLNTYVRVGLLNKPLKDGKRGSESDTVSVHALYFDCDIAGDGHKGDHKLVENVDRALLIANGIAGLEPSIIVNTGHGIQGYYLLNEPLNTSTIDGQFKAKMLAKHLEEALKITAHNLGGYHVDSVHDIARILRVPGSENRKPNCPPVAVEVLKLDASLRYSVADIEAKLAAYPRKPVAEPKPYEAPRKSVSLSDERLIDKMLNEAANSDKVRKLWNNEVPGNEGDYALAQNVLWWTNGDIERTQTIMEQSGRNRAKWTEKHWSDTSEEGLLYGTIYLPHTIKKTYDLYFKDGYEGSAGDLKAAVLDEMLAESAEVAEADEIVEVADQVAPAELPDIAAPVNFQKHKQAEKSTPKGKASDETQATEKLDLTKITMTDRGNAEILQALFGNDIHWIEDEGVWAVWNEKYWRRDEQGLKIAHRTKKVAEMWQKLAKKTFEQVGDAENDTIKKSLEKQAASYAKWATTSEMTPRIKAMMDVFKSLPGVAVERAQFDANIWLLNTQNKTINVQTGEVYGHRRDDMLTAVLKISYDPAATCPRFLQFMQEIMQDKAEMVDYLRRVLSMGLTGDVSDEKFYIFWGEGSNGKSKLLEVVSALLDELAIPVDPDAFLVSKYSESKSIESLSKMAGKRFAYTSEVKRGGVLNMARIKSITGGDLQVGRFLYGHQFEYDPTATVFMATNPFPTIPDSDDGTWRRIRIIPFNQKFSDKPEELAKGAMPMNPRLKEELLAELPGILNWLLGGARLWLAEGIKEPQEVLDLVTKARSEASPTDGWLEDRCKVGDPKYFATTGDLYDDYAEWAAEERIENALTKIEFGRFLGKLAKDGVPIKDGKSSDRKRVRGWSGIRLLLPAERKERDTKANLATAEMKVVNALDEVQAKAHEAEAQKLLGQIIGMIRRGDHSDAILDFIAFKRDCDFEAGERWYASAHEE